MMREDGPATTHLMFVINKIRDHKRLVVSRVRYEANGMRAYVLDCDTNESVILKIRPATPREDIEAARPLDLEPSFEQITQEAIRDGRAERDYERRREADRGVDEPMDPRD